MKETIPLYQLNALSNDNGNLTDIFFPDEDEEQPRINIRVPYRSNYYKIGICLKGHATLKANMVQYQVRPGSLMVMPPDMIKQWPEISPDFEALSIFFTKTWMTAGNGINLDIFPFWDSLAQHAFEISTRESEHITQSLLDLQRKYATPHPYRKEILKSHITGLLYEIAAMYDQHKLVSNAGQTRAQQLFQEFRKWVLNHAPQQRALKFYAEKLCITPKHLTETVKEISGKTAGEWIADAVLMEAKFLLHDPDLNVAQVAGLLHFSDPAAFSRFFKKNSGLSPIAYKQLR
jgi:AraC family transcriptional activator of pobA